MASVEKAKPLTMREWIEENRGFWLLLACTLIPIFFQLDQTLGAAGLRAIYGDAALIAGFSLIVLGLFLGPILTPTTRFEFKALSLLLIGLILLLLVDSNLKPGGSVTAFLFIMMFATAPLAVLLIFPSIVYLLVAVILIAIRLAYGLRLMSANVLKFPDIVMVGFAIMMGLALLSVGTFYHLSGLRNLSRLPLNTHIYQLQVVSGGFDNPSTMTLYQCNAQGLWCESVYEKSAWDVIPYGVSEQAIQLTATADSTGVQIRVGSEVMYTYVPPS